jgi:hypothetical protein
MNNQKHRHSGMDAGQIGRIADLHALRPKGAA